MFLLRILLAIVTLPFFILAFVFRLICVILLGIGNLFANIFGGLLLLGGVLMLITGDAGTGISAIAVGAFLFAIPYIGGFLIGLFDAFIDWVKGLVFG